MILRRDMLIQLVFVALAIAAVLSATNDNRGIVLAIIAFSFQLHSWIGTR